MFLFYFRSEKLPLIEASKNIIVKNKNYYYTLIGPNKNELLKLKKKLTLSKTKNPFNSLINDEIAITPTSVSVNNTIFDNAYHIAKDIFLKEIIDHIDDEKFINFYNNNIIHLPLDIKIPCKFNYVTKTKYPIQFRKNIFLQNWDFLCELEKMLEPYKKSIKFQKITKYIWKKNITFLNPEEHPRGHNK